MQQRSGCQTAHSWSSIRTTNGTKPGNLSLRSIKQPTEMDRLLRPSRVNANMALAPIEQLKDQSDYRRWSQEVEKVLKRHGFENVTNFSTDIECEFAHLDDGVVRNFVLRSLRPEQAQLVRQRSTTREVWRSVEIMNKACFTCHGGHYKLAAFQESAKCGCKICQIYLDALDAIWPRLVPLKISKDQFTSNIRRRGWKHTSFEVKIYKSEDIKFFEQSSATIEVHAPQS